MKSSLNSIGEGKSISVVITTFRRTDLLLNLMKSLMNQQVIAEEVIIVDNDPAGSAKSVIEGFLTLNPLVKVNYLSNTSNSLSSARNLGVSKVKTPFVCLLDDDVAVPDDFLKRVLDGITQLPNAIAIQGMLNIPKRSLIRNLIALVSGQFYLSKKSCKIRTSISATYPSRYCGVVPLKCEWISGSNQVYVTSKIQGIYWDENLIEYSDGEDLDFSFRLKKHSVGEFYILPDLQITHFESQVSRTIGYRAIMMRETYSYYLLNKLFPKQRRAFCFYLWSRCALIMIHMFQYLFSGFKTQKLEVITYYIRAYKFVFSQRFLLKNGQIERANRILREN